MRDKMSRVGDIGKDALKIGTMIFVLGGAGKVLAADKAPNITSIKDLDSLATEYLKTERVSERELRKIGDSFYSEIEQRAISPEVQRSLDSLKNKPDYEKIKKVYEMTSSPEAPDKGVAELVKYLGTLGIHADIGILPFNVVQRNGKVDPTIPSHKYIVYFSYKHFPGWIKPVTCGNKKDVPLLGGCKSIEDAINAGYESVIGWEGLLIYYDPCDHRILRSNK